jgi:hypothetical protein
MRLPRPLPALDVQAALNYLCPTSAVPISYAFEPPPGTPWESAAYEARTVPIADGRRTAPPSIQHEGFELHHAPTRVRNFDDEDQVTSLYYAECVELALAVTGAQRAFVFDHLLRRRSTGPGALNFGRRTQGRYAAANGRIHNDYTEASGRRRLGMVLTDPADAAKVRRYAVVNIWRSIAGPVRDTPLAVCDARSVLVTDLVVGEVRYPKRTGEIYYLTHSPLHRWSYFPEMDHDEALVFKQFDSQASGTSRFTPHAAFDLPDVPPDTPARESIELRCLVVFDANT